MIVLHTGIEGEGLLLWGERPLGDAEARPARRRGRKPRIPRPAGHPFAADAEALAAALAAAGLRSRKRRTEERFAWLPSAGGRPLASSPLIGDPPAVRTPAHLIPWSIAVVRLGAGDAVELLCACVDRDTLAPGLVIGKDLAFAATTLRAAGALVARQRFLPGIEERDDTLRAVWRPVLAAPDAELLARLARGMPDACRALHRKADRPPDSSALPLATGFVGAIVDHLVRSAAAEGAPHPPRRGTPRSFDSPHEAWLNALRSADGDLSGPPAELARLAAQVRDWQRPLAVTVAAPFRLTFRLEEPPESPPPGNESRSREAPRGADGNGAAWSVHYLLQATHDPSLLVPAAEAWKERRSAPLPLRRAGFDARELLLASLGRAAAIDPEVETSLRTAAPSGHSLDATGAFTFLSERSTALEQAGFGVLLPAWWTRKGTKNRLTAKAVVRSPRLRAGGGLSLDDLVRFRWQVALGDVALSAAELHALADLKVPLVRLRGQWVQVNAEEIEAALAFWKNKGEQAAPVRDVVRMALGGVAAPGGLAFEGVEASGWVGDLLGRLDSHAALAAVPPPVGFRGTLRPYQLRGVSWLAFLKECGFGACLADDMGLGKTVQTLALIQREWRAGRRLPVLLVCPTSVVGNWEKEAVRFTPELPVLVHHGLARRRGGALRREAQRHAIVLSSYPLLHRDLEALQQVRWSGLVLDEAQNIKNPETKQARAARAITADYRIALTGTPVENTVLDLWSLMQFLNPRFLGSQAEFKRSFFIPIQAGRDRQAMERLKRLTGPFVLRRLKTDKTIIADLPEKMEMKVYCTLTPEQASLYAAVVAEASDALEGAAGITLKGVVLATLAKLKQVCNHPAHFLGDNSPISDRSGKLARLTEMLDEVLAEGDRALVFSQFTEMGEILRRHLQETFGREALFLHGGVAKKERDRMVERFQSADGAPSLFILSLKAGGTGLNLTRANHVFHFDRWWNPAVETQATDRAFRIGQTRRVLVHKLLCAGTLEEKIDEMIEGKKELAERIVGTGEGWLTRLSTAELKEIFALRGAAVAEQASFAERDTVTADSRVPALS